MTPLDLIEITVAALVLALVWTFRWRIGTALRAWLRSQRKDIMDLDSPNDIYLTRFFLVKLPFLGVYLHIIRRPDYERCMHDHPWPFLTIILKGGYEEEVRGALYNRLHVRRPGYIGYRPRNFTHRITRLLNGNAITLVFRGIDGIDWNFHTASGERMRWQDFSSAPGRLRVMWCTHE